MADTILIMLGSIVTNVHPYTLNLREAATITVVNAMLARYIYYRTYLFGGDLKVLVGFNIGCPKLYLKLILIYKNFQIKRKIYLPS